MPHERRYSSGGGKLAVITAYLGLGSNLGDRKQNLAQALELLSHQVAMEQISSIYETQPVGYEPQPLFLNTVCCIRTVLSPEELLSLAKQIEARMGRVSSFPNAPRLIDIDILFYEHEVIKRHGLIIPHPRLAERAFVLIPLAEIAPGLVHPETGKTIKQLADSLESSAGVTKWAEAEEVMNRRHNVSGIR